MSSYFLDYIHHNFILLFVLGGISIMTEIGQRIRSERANIQRLMVGIIFALSVTDYIEYYYSFGTEFYEIREIAAVVGYWLRPLVGVTAVLLISEEKKISGLIWVPAIINFLVYSTAFFSNICIYYVDNVFQRGPLYYTVFLISFCYILIFVYMLALKVRDRHWGAVSILFFSIIVIAWSAVWDANAVRNSLLFPVLAVSTLFYYLYLQMEVEKVKSLERELKLHTQQDQLMISQIQPHFMYNTLATAAYLCNENPALAEKTILQFSDYLRQNMNALSITEPIPFEQELKHTKIYTDIEMLRFDNIEVRYVIENENFRIPALTVQPMVENAIRHGVRSRSNGIVEVHSWKTEEYNMIEIRDNGVGFNTSAPLSTDRVHVGLQNVRERLKNMVGGSMEIRSTIGQGTRIMIKLPVTKST